MSADSERLVGMTSSDRPDDAGPVAGLESTRRLLHTLRRQVLEAIDDLETRLVAVSEEAKPVTSTFARPVKAPPVRMEQLARTPEPTADLDDLVDLLVPRLLERLIPELRDALKVDH
jgi:hypothetical protein